MNDDDKFFAQFHKAPRPELVAAVYQRINRPMNATTKQFNLRRMALSFAAVSALLLAVLWANPVSRAQAFSFLHQIGVIRITTEQPADPGPTVAAPDPAQRPLGVDTAAQASELTGFNVFSLEKVPDGFEAQSPFNILTQGEGKNVVSTFANPTRDHFILINQHRFTAADAFIDNITGQETVQDVQVRSHPGVWITERMMTNPAEGGLQIKSGPIPTNWLIWEESGIVYTVISDDLSLEQMLELAQNLK